MSCLRPLPIKLSPRARADFIDILRFTGETWGRDQLVVYRDKINEAIMALSQNPQLGHCRDDLPSTHLVYPVGSHLIVYRPGGESLGVVRILHKRMSPTLHIK